MSIHELITPHFDLSQNTEILDKSSVKYSEDHNARIEFTLNVELKGGQARSYKVTINPDKHSLIHIEHKSLKHRFIDFFTRRTLKYSVAKTAMSYIIEASTIDIAIDNQNLRKKVSESEMILTKAERICLTAQKEKVDISRMKDEILMINRENRALKEKVEEDRKRFAEFQAIHYAGVAQKRYNFEHLVEETYDIVN